MGDQNNLTYKDVFPLIKKGLVWLGVENGGKKWFQVPDNYNINTKSRKKIVDGIQYFSKGSINWFTNLDHKKRHQPLILTKHWSRHEHEYEYYDNYDAINVDKVANIPEGFDGVMGVPISFLDKHNPEQFEIVGIANSARWIGYECFTLIEGRKIYNRILIKKRQR